jgi:SAM-dependent methyltransferase
MPIRKTKADWTSENVRKLWDWYGTNRHLQGTYFTSMVGEGVVNFLAATGKLQGKALDYGCGTGHVIDHLLKRGLECHAVDSSQDSVAVVNAKFAGHSGWKGAVAAEGAKIPFPDDFFDILCCIEILEHLPQDLIAPFLGELRRVVRRSGLILFTTPFEEILERNHIYCPFCDAEYHKWQHFRSFSVESLTALITSAGLGVQFCRSMDFWKFQETFGLSILREVSINGLISALSHRKRLMLDRIFPAEFPGGRDVQYRLGAGSGSHLCALATKGEAGG